MFLTCCNSWLSLRFIFLILALWYRFRAARSWQQQADHWKFWIGRWVSGKTHWRRWSTWGCAGGSRTSYTRLGAISYVRREIQNGISNNWIFPILAYSHHEGVLPNILIYNPKNTNNPLDRRLKMLRDGLPVESRKRKPSEKPPNKQWKFDLTNVETLDDEVESMEFKVIQYYNRRNRIISPIYYV